MKNKMPNWQRMILSGQFADWFYLRTGMLATTPLGEKLRKMFLDGKTVSIRHTPKESHERKR